MKEHDMFCKIILINHKQTNNNEIYEKESKIKLILTKETTQEAGITVVDQN